MYTHTDTPAMHLFDITGVDTHTHPSHALTSYVIVNPDGMHTGFYFQSSSAVCAMFTYTTMVHGACVGFSAVSLADWTAYVITTEDAATRPNFYDWTISRMTGTETEVDSYMCLG
jgi:hypothetical protein